MEVWYFGLIVPRIIVFRLLATSTKTRWFAVCVRYAITYSVFRYFSIYYTNSSFVSLVDAVVIESWTI